MTLQDILERERVRELGVDIGYGNIIRIALKLWKKNSKIVPCGCEKPNDCDWCAGTGWLTERCKRAKDYLEAFEPGSLNETL